LVAWLAKCLVGFWVCKSKAAEIIQTYANIMNIICLCKASENNGLRIYYFTSTLTSLKSLCTTEAIITDIINQKCLSTIITIPQDFDAPLASAYVQELENLCLQPVYKDTILLVKHEDRLLLFGLIDSVKNFNAEHEKMKQKYTMAQVKHDLKNYQVGFNNEIYCFEKMN
jgi:hypothetical protein